MATPEANSSTFKVSTLEMPIQLYPSSGQPAKKAVRKLIKKSPKKALKKSKKLHVSQVQLLLNQPSLFGQPIFNIFPSNYPSPQLNIYLSMMGNSLKSRIQFLKTIRQQLVRFPTPKSIQPLPAALPWCSRLVVAVQCAHTQLVKVRARFRKFLQLWRYKRLKLASEEDIVTCEKPEVPIALVDWNTKTRYIFEASTLMKDITNRLLTFDGFFDDAQPPRNPYTNQPFTLAQSISLWNQLSRSKEPASWSFTCFASSKFCLKRFISEYRIPLQLNALRATMADPTDYDQRERLLDFIQYEHELEDAQYYKNTYHHAVIHLQEEPRMVKWRLLCTEFYEAHIKFQHNQVVMKQIHEQIHEKCASLLEKPQELIALYKQALQSQPPPLPIPAAPENTYVEIDVLDFFTNVTAQNLYALLAALPPPLPPAQAPPITLPLPAVEIEESLDLAIAMLMSLEQPPSNEDN